MRVRRITGFDLIVACLLPIILYYSFHLGLGQNKAVFRRDQFHIVFDGAVAVFLFINGLTTGFATISGQSPRLMSKYLVRKGSLFLIMGLALSFVRVPDFFVLLGLSSLAAAVLIPLTSTLIRVFVTILLLVSFYLYFLTDGQINIAPFFGEQPIGFIKHFITSGYYAILPWMVFYFGGVLHSRRLIFRVERPDWATTVIGLILIGLALAVEVFLSSRFHRLTDDNSAPFPVGHLHLLFPSFIIGAFGLAFILSNLALKLNRPSFNDRFKVFKNFAKMKYSVLLALVIAGYFASLRIGPFENFGYRTIILFSLLVTGVTVIFSFIWLKKFSNGPVEMILRQLTPKK